MEIGTKVRVPLHTPPATVVRDLGWSCCPEDVHKEGRHSEMLGRLPVQRVLVLLPPDHYGAQYVQAFDSVLDWACSEVPELAIRP